MKKQKKTPKITRPPEVQSLHRLSDFLGIQTGYNSAFGHYIDSAPEGIAYVLNSLGYGVKEDLSNVNKILEEAQKQYWQQTVEPILTVWEGKPTKLVIRTIKSKFKPKCELTIRTEQGKLIRLPINLSKLRVQNKTQIEGLTYEEKTFTITKKLPIGYHDAELKIGDKTFNIFIISAPFKAYRPKTKEGSKRICGIFAPLYALRSKTSWGIGDFTELGKFIDWSYSLNCDFVGTLPMLAAFTDKPTVEPSPYSPVSRVFWNEIFIDPRLAQEWKECSFAREIAESSSFKDEIQKQQDLKEVDYQSVALLKRRVLEPMAQYFFEQGKDQNVDFKRFLCVQAFAPDYAEFRAACDKTNSMWREWPEKMKSGQLDPGDYDENDKKYYLYCQFLVHEQLSKLAKAASREGRRGIYLDFPLSAHANGYDVWRERDSFVHTVSAGCPPDPAHMHGQDWGILPLNPRGIRENKYKYVRACLDNHMRYAGFLRLDHVMAFFRLFWVPKGKTARDGVYVRYNLNEFFALLSLESHRNKCTLIGEDLGTVPPEIREAMRRHGIMRMYCQQRRLKPEEKAPFSDMPEDCICSLNTHDMPPFAAFWQGLEIEDKMKLGYFGPDQMEIKKQERFRSGEALVNFLQKKKLLGKTYELKDVLKAILLLTAKDKCRVMQVNIEDLWLETLSQNVPGTWKERPNWKRKLAYSIDSFGELKDLPELFANIMKLRRGR